MILLVSWKAFIFMVILNINCKWSYCYHSVKASIERYKKASSDSSNGGSASEANAQVLLLIPAINFFNRAKLNPSALFEPN